MEENTTRSLKITIDCHATNRDIGYVYVYVQMYYMNYDGSFPINVWGGMYMYYCMLHVACILVCIVCMLLKKFENLLIYIENSEKVCMYKNNVLNFSRNK